MKISAVLVTRGNVDLAPVLQTLPFADIVIYDNSKLKDSKVFGRYLAMDQCKNDVVYVQDDDAITDPGRICEQYQQGYIVANVPPDRRPFYSDGVTLIGWGAVFHRSLVGCFHRYLAHWPMDDLFLRECDRIFTGLNRTRNIDVPFAHLPHAHHADRMGQEKRHLQDLATIRERLAQLKRWTH